MIIEIPYQYEVHGIERGRRLTSSSRGIAVTMANVPDVDPSELSTALVLRDELAAYAHTFYHFGDAFWVRDRALQDEPFGTQHMMLMGRWPAKAHTRKVGRNRTEHYTKYDADRDNATCTTGLGAIGLLEYVTTNAHMGQIVKKDGQYQSGYRLDGEALHTELNSAEEGYRTIDRTDMRSRADEAASYAMKNTISVDGELYHRVHEPVAYASGSVIDWCFSKTLKPLDSHWQSERDQDRASADAYRVSMTELDALIEANPEIMSKGGVKFYIEQIDSRFFGKRDLTPLIVKDIAAAINGGSSIHRQPTSYITLWCELRDMLAGHMKTLDVVATETLDRAADLLTELDSISGRNDYPGAQMWRERSIDFSSSELTPTSTPKAF